MYKVDGGIPADPTHRFTAKEFATVKADIRASAPGQQGRLMSWPTLGTLEGGLWGVVPQTLPRTLTEYFSGGNGVAWTTRFTHFTKDSGEGYDLNDRPRSYVPGKTYPTRWNYPVYGPSFPDYQVARFPFVGRRLDTIHARVPMFADGDVNRWGYAGNATGSAELYRDGVKVDTSADPQRATFEVPAGDGAYRLVVNAKNSDATVSGEWTFRSAHAPQYPATPLALTAVRYLPTVDKDGTVAASATRIPLAVQSQVASPVRSLTLDVSYDDGKTWQPTTVSKDGSGWCATLASPGKAGAWVSVRSRVTTADGATGKQTLLRAYRLR
jgi:hypothetical protein